jgi:hypothetical protein
MTGLLTNLGAREKLLFGQQPLRLNHRLHESPLFARDALARLIETYPRAHYSLIAMGGAAMAGAAAVTSSVAASAALKIFFICLLQWVPLCTSGSTMRPGG